jgi:hypothetical protein
MERATTESAERGADQQVSNGGAMMLSKLISLSELTNVTQGRARPGSRLQGMHQQYQKPRTLMGGT